MKAKKALKKLKKAISPAAASTAQRQLASLKKHSAATTSTTSASSNRLKNDLKGVANQAAFSAIQELAAPLNPLLSWFNDSGTGFVFSPSQPQKNDTFQSSANDANATFEIKSVGYLPLKSPPCKRCPALSNGICKCAAKKFKLSA